MNRAHQIYLMRYFRAIFQEDKQQAAAFDSQHFMQLQEEKRALSVVHAIGKHSFIKVRVYSEFCWQIGVRWYFAMCTIHQVSD